MQITFDPTSRRAYPVPAPLRLAGLGQSTPAPSAESIASVAASGAAATASILGGLSAAATTAGSGFLAGASVFGMAASAAIPLIGAAVVALTAIGIAIANQFKGCGQTCIEATKIVNQVEPYLNQNVTAYQNAPIHYASLQAAALNNFMTGWNACVAACSNSQLGTAGQNCISTRQSGACHYKTSPGGWQKDSEGIWTYVIPGPNGSGDACWNWWVGYHDPIANDPTVVPDPIGQTASFGAGGQEVLTGTPVSGSEGASTTLTPGSTLTGSVASASEIPWPLILGAGALALMLSMSSSSGGKR